MTEQRTLALDYGSVRVGVAISDPLQLIATSLETMKRDETLLPRLRELVHSRNVVRVVLGHPLNLRGERSRSTVEVEEFAAVLRRELNIEVVLWDERFTTTIAQQRLRELEVKRRKRTAASGRVDAMAAVVLLQNYLDSHRRVVGSEI